MNRSIVITRYARALEKYVRETGGGAVVAGEAEILRETLGSVPDLLRVVNSRDMVTKAEKKTLLVSALGGKSSTEMGRFLDLVLQKGREDLLPEILRDFTVIHERANGIRRARLTVVSTPPEKLLESLRKLVRDTTGDDARIEVTIDPSLIGGFVFDIDDYLLDASVKRQLDIIKEQFIEKNRRII